MALSYQLSKNFRGFNICFAFACDKKNPAPAEAAPPEVTTSATPSMQAAVRQAIQTAKDEQARAERESERVREEDQRQTRAAFNAASGVIEGLNFLRDMPGSTFSYKVRELSGRVDINTNIPVSGEHHEPHTATIRAEADGQLSVQGPFRFDARSYEDAYEEIKVKNTDPQANETIVAYVTTLAANSGLIR